MYPFLFSCELQRFFDAKGNKWFESFTTIEAGWTMFLTQIYYKVSKACSYNGCCCLCLLKYSFVQACAKSTNLTTSCYWWPDKLSRMCNHTRIVPMLVSQFLFRFSAGQSSHDMEPLLAIWEGNLLATAGFPSQWTCNAELWCFLCC